MWKISQQGSIKSIHNDSMTKGKNSLSNQIESIDSWANATWYMRERAVYLISWRINLQKAGFVSFVNYDYLLKWKFHFDTESPREKQFKILRHAAMLWWVLQSMHGCLVREENCRYLVQSIKIVGINCHSQPEPWTCLFMSHSAEIEKKENQDSNAKRVIWNVLC